jgi:hypothetical protein
MASFFKKHKRTPAELATKLGNALNTLAEGGDDKVRRFSLRSFALDLPMPAALPSRTRRVFAR